MTTSTKSGISNFKFQIVISLGLLGLTFLLYLPTRHHDYTVYDDPQYVERNDRVLHGLSWDNARWAFTTLKMANWHPLAWLSHMLDIQIFGPEPGPQHLMSAGIHALNAALLFLALLVLTRGTLRPPVQDEKEQHGRAARATICASLVAVLFAVHPLRMESVAWISERKDLLCAMFFFIALACYGNYARRQSWAWYGATLVAFALGLLSKPMIVTFPCVLLLLDCWPLERPARRNLLVEKIPFVLMSIGASIVTFIAQRAGGAMEPETYPLGIRLANAVWAFGRYIRKTFLPSDLAAFYPYEGVVRGTQFPWMSAAITGLVLLLITAIALAAWRRERALLVGWLWFLGMLVPTIGIVQVGSQALADRYSYLPQIGLLIALVYGGAAVAGRWPAWRGPLIGLAGAFAVVLAICTAYQLRYWKDSATLFGHALEVTDHNATANVSIAIYLTLHHQGDQAIPYYNRALELSPGMAEAHSNLGALLGERGQTQAALDHLVDATKLDPKNADAKNNLGNLLSKIGHVSQALHQYGEAVRLDPDSAQIRYNLAMTLSQAGRFDEADRQFAQALRLRPSYPPARFGYALALIASGELDEGKREFEQFLEEKPDATDAMAQFAWALATAPESRSRDPKSAIALAEHLNQLTLGERADYLDVLAAAYASAGEFERAISLAKQAQTLALGHGQNDLAERIGHRIDLYRTKQPYLTLPPATTRASTPTSP